MANAEWTKWSRSILWIKFEPTLETWLLCLLYLQKGIITMMMLWHGKDFDIVGAYREVPGHWTFDGFFDIIPDKL